VFQLSPKSCANPWSDSGDRELELGELTRGLLFIPRAQASPVLSVSTSIGFSWLNVLVSSLLSCVAAVSSSVRFGAQKVRFVVFGLPSLDRYDRRATPA
jgi:hypothetical protein